MNATLRPATEPIVITSLGLPYGVSISTCSTSSSSVYNPDPPNTPTVAELNRLILEAHICICMIPQPQAGPAGRLPGAALGPCRHQNRNHRGDERGPDHQLVGHSQQREHDRGGAQSQDGDCGDERRPRPAAAPGAEKGPGGKQARGHEGAQGDELIAAHENEPRGGGVARPLSRG